MLRTVCLSLLFLLLAQHTSYAQSKLEWKFAGTTYIDVKHVAKQEVVVLGQRKKTATTIRFVFEVKPARVTPKETVLDVTVVKCEDTTQEGDGEENTFKGYKDQKFQVILTPRNQGLEIKASKDLAEAVFGAEATSGTDDEKKLHTDIAVAVLRVHLLDALVPLPEKTPLAGDKWHNTTQVVLQPLAQLIIDREYVLGEPQTNSGKTLDKITWTSKVTLKPLDDEKGVLPFKIKEINVTTKPTNEGTILWDRTAQRPASIDAVQTYDMKMKMEINGKVVDCTGSGHDTFTFRLSETNPVGK